MGPYSDEKSHEGRESSIVHVEESGTVQQAVHGQVKAIHLYKEDSQGQVLARLLVPRPTDDARDPLTWSAISRHIAFGSVSFLVFLSNYVTSSISPGLLFVAEEFKATSSMASYWVTFPILAIGVGNLFWIPVSLKIGKRPVLIMTSAIFFAGCIWAAKAQSSASMLGARIVQGFGASASDGLGPAVGDLYFVHERGTYVGVYSLMIATGSAFGGLFSGFIINATSNWRWIFWMDSILTGTCCLIISLFLPETSFARPVTSEEGAGPDVMSVPHRHKLAWKQRLSVTGWRDETPLWRHFWNPVTTLRYPAVWWAALIVGVLLGLVVIQLTLNSIYFPALYHFSGLAVGNLNISNLIACVLACLYAGPVSDWVVRYITKRRMGYFKPEYRLWAMIPPIIFTPIGIMLWGCGLGLQLHPMVAIAGYGITNGVLASAPIISTTYLVDCYRPFASETMTIMTSFKNTFAFAVSFGVIPWLQEDGFIEVAGLSTFIVLVILLSSIPMYIYGERIRTWTSKVDT